MPNQIERDVYVLEDGIENPISYVRATNAIPIVFHFRDYEIPDGATAQVFVNKPSGLAVYNSATISGNSVIVDTTMQMFAELGTSEMQIQISKDEDSLVTFSYPVKVAQNYIEYPSSQNESSLYNEIQDAISDAEVAITTANQAAQAANDAAEAVAEAVSGVIDDNQSSNLTTYSSEKIDEDFLKKAGDTVEGDFAVAAGSKLKFPSQDEQSRWEIDNSNTFRILYMVGEDLVEVFQFTNNGNLIAGNGVNLDGLRSTMNVMTNNMNNFQYKTDLLDVDTSDPIADKNWVHRISTQNAGNLQNSPVTTGFFYGKWEIIYLLSTNILVQITEFIPNQGRMWFNRWNGSSWTGWVSNT